MNRVVTRPQRKKRRSPLQSPVAIGIIAALAGVLLFLAYVNLLGDAGDEEKALPSTVRSPGAAATVASEGQPDLSRRAGGLSEGAVSADLVERDPPGRKFPLPLQAHAGIEDYFGTSRLYGQMHGGVDFSLRGLNQATVLSVCDGTVATVDESAQLGLHMVIDCGDTWEFVVGFLDSATATPGAAVSVGASIGVGSAGAHLHVELRYGGKVVDPANHMELPRRVVIPPTPTPTSTPTPTPRPAATQSDTGSGAGAEPTSTPTPGPTSTSTATPTVTNTPTITPTPTWTPTPTRTPQARPPTPTPLPVSR